MKSKLLLVAFFGCLLATAPAADNTAKRVAKQPPSAPAPAAPTPQTLEQMPAVPPQVAFQGGQLTIAARNSTLGDILKAVRSLTGAEIEMPGSGSERVVGSFGPGPARDVLAALLYGSHFNYVLLGSETDPQALNRVMLFAKTAAEGEATPAETASAASYRGNNVAPAYQNMTRPFPGRPGMPVPNAANQQAAADTGDADAQAEDDSSDADSSDDQADDQSGDTETVEGEEPGQVKSPEQMLQELQQQQLQQQQQQQQQNQPGFPPGIRPGFPPGMQPGMPGYPPGVTPPNQGPQQQQ